MPWYDWVFVYMLIIGGFVWYIIPEKTLLFNALTLGAALFGYLGLKHGEKLLKRKS